MNRIIFYQIRRLICAWNTNAFTNIRLSNTWHIYYAFYLDALRSFFTQGKKHSGLHCLQQMHFHYWYFAWYLDDFNDTFTISFSWIHGTELILFTNVLCHIDYGFIMNELQLEPTWSDCNDTIVSLDFGFVSFSKSVSLILLLSWLH